MFVTYKKSDLLFSAAESYQNARNALEDQFEKDMKSIEGYKGDKYYEERAEQFRKQRDADMATLQADARRELSSILESMRETVNKIPPTMPSSEVVNMITLLNMREKITQSEIDTAAKAASDCPAALKLLDEIVDRNSKKGNALVKVSHRFGTGMSSDRAMEILESDNTVDEFIKYNSTKAARIAAASNKRRFGTETPLARRKTFNDKEGCFEELFCIEGDAYEKFCEMVDMVDAV